MALTIQRLLLDDFQAVPDPKDTPRIWFHPQTFLSQVGFLTPVFILLVRST